MALAGLRIGQGQIFRLGVTAGVQPTSRRHERSRNHGPRPTVVTPQTYPQNPLNRKATIRITAHAITYASCYVLALVVALVGRLLGLFALKAVGEEVTIGRY